MTEILKSKIAAIGIDIGKNWFHVVGLDGRGAIALRQKWSRGQVEAHLANMPACLIGMEACVGAPAGPIDRWSSWPRTSSSGAGPPRQSPPRRGSRSLDDLFLVAREVRQTNLEVSGGRGTPHSDGPPFLGRLDAELDHGHHQPHLRGG